MGVVRQHVKRSAGKSGSIGKSSVDPHEASCIQLRTGGIAGIFEPWAKALYWSKRKHYIFIKMHRKEGRKLLFLPGKEKGVHY